MVPPVVGSRAQRELLAERKRMNIAALGRLDEGGARTNALEASGSLPCAF